MNNEIAQPYVIGIDLGTGSCKTVILSLNGVILGFGSSDYKAGDVHTQWEEQPPDSILGGMISSVRAAVQTAKVLPKSCKGISIGGALHSLLVLDDKGTPLTGVMTWADRRAAKQSEQMGSLFNMSALYARTGCPNHPMYPITKIVWVKEERPDIFEKAAWFISAKEYVVWKLTGRRVVDYAIASGTGLLHQYTLDWDETALEIASLRQEQLFEPCSPDTLIGRVNKNIAKQMGMSAEVPVFLGSADAVNSNLGNGTMFPNQGTCMVGTSGAVRIISPRPVFDKKGRIWCYGIDSAHWLIGGAINNGGLALSWFKDALNQGRSIEETVGFEDLIRWAESIPPGASGVICLPFFAGERCLHWNANATGGFFGLSIQHDQRHLARAILEGVAFRLRSVLDVLQTVVGELNEIRASGGFTKSELWLQITSDVFNKEILLVTSGETSALGAAFWAFLGIGEVNRLEDLCSLVKVTKRIKPDPDRNELYERVYIKYCQLYSTLSPFFTQ